MHNENLFKTLQLINTDGIGCVSFYKLIKKYGDTNSAIEAVAAKQAVCDKKIVENIIEKSEQLNAEIILYDSDKYPKCLLELNDAPPVLYALGNTKLLNYPFAVSIVGARNASIAGRKMASRLAYDLTANDVLVVSGMARGIDSAAHKGALYAKQQKGSTIAVLGTGIDEIYPPENAELYQNIITQGLVISEFPFGTKAQISTFPRRNRIIAGLSQGVVVVEASQHSGSLITARLALEQGKEIFAVPGSPLENRSAGPNMLIKEGALLTENAQDILNVLSMNNSKQIKSSKLEGLPLDKAENKVNISQKKKSEPQNVLNVKLLDLISYEGVDIDVLLRNCQLPQADFFSELLDLEFAGKIQRQAGNKVARIK